MLNHQDWDTVVFTKKQHHPASVINKNKNTQATVCDASNKPAWKIEKQVDSDECKPIKYVAREDAQKIINGRIVMKLSQKDLACRLNMSLKDIQDIESCKAVENKLNLSRIKKVLQIN